MLIPKTLHVVPAVLPAVIVAAALFVSAGAASAQLPTGWPEAKDGEPRCGWCKTTGRTELELASKWGIESEGGDTWEVLYCSVAIEDDHHGLDWEPCQRCKTPSLKTYADALYEKTTKAQQTWLAERRRVDEIANSKKPVVHVETTHFVIAFDLSKIKTAEKKTYKTHEAAHLYAQRFEELYARFQEMFGVEDANNMKNKHYVMMFEKQAQAYGVAPAYTGLNIGGASSVKRSGGVKHESTIVTWLDKSEIPGDPELHRHQTHHIAHQLTAILYDVRWFEPGKIGLSPPWLNDKYGWLDAGLAHWFEIELDGKATTYCMREQDTSSRYRGDDWKKNVYKAVVGGDVPSFPEVISKPTQALSAREHQFVWSWVDYLLDRDEAAMGKALKMTKLEKPVRDILKDCWQVSMIGMEDGWMQWVEENYAPTKKGR